MELIVMCDALRRASASRITAVVPYFGYARQDRRPRSARVPITAKVVADIMVGVGIDRVLTVDLHADQIQGFFDVAVDNIYATPVMLEDIQRHQPRDVTVVSPDVGGVLRARAMAKLIDTDLAIIDKRRPRANQTEVMNIIGDVDGRRCILFDDIVDSGGTLVNAAKALMDQGAVEVSAYISHGVLSGPAVQRDRHPVHKFPERFDVAGSSRGQVLLDLAHELTIALEGSPNPLPNHVGRHVQAEAKQVLLDFVVLHVLGHDGRGPLWRIRSGKRRAGSHAAQRRT